MYTYDAIIIGGGPAGLTAGLYLSRGQHRTLLLEKESFGGYLTKLEWIENYPGYAEGVSGVQLASEMVKQAGKYGLEIKQGEVAAIKIFSKNQSVKLAGGGAYTAKVIIIAGGARPKKIGVPGEKELQNKGVMYCSFCEGSQCLDKVVAVCGGGNAGITEALYLTKLALKVILFEIAPVLTADAIIQERARGNPKLEIRCGARVEAILGKEKVEAVKWIDVKDGREQEQKVDGVLVHVGLEPNTGYLNGIIPLDPEGKIMVNERLETKVPCILAAGEVRSGSVGQIVTAAADGARAAFTAIGLLQKTSPA